ncbi:hypothetical protein D3C84_1267180 [compost metagenome]
MKMMPRASLTNSVSLPWRHSRSSSGNSSLTTIAPRNSPLSPVTALERKYPGMPLVTPTA